MQEGPTRSWAWAGGGLVGVGAGGGATTALLLFGAEALAIGTGAGAACGSPVLLASRAASRAAREARSWCSGLQVMPLRRRTVRSLCFESSRTGSEAMALS